MRENQKRDLARSLRSTMTDAEKRLWRYLRHEQMSGLKFRRQFPVGPYVADFACLSHHLIIEADGGQHNGSIHDEARDAYLHSSGWKVLRFWNNDILSNTQGVLKTIRIYVEACPHPNPPPQAGEGKVK